MGRSVNKALSKAEKLNALRERKKQLVVDLNLLKEDQKRLKANLTATQQGLTSVAAQIKALSEQHEGISVTDHAVVRYLERVQGIDIEAIRKEIASPALMKTVEALGGTGKYPIDGGRAVMDGFTVVTVESNG